MGPQREELMILISVEDITYNDMRGTIQCFDSPYKVLMEDMILKIEECIEFVQQNQIISSVTQNCDVHRYKEDYLTKYLFLVHFRNYENKCRRRNLYSAERKCNWTFDNMLELLKLMTDSINLFNESLYSDSFSIK